MATYRYRAATAAGTLESGTLEAPSRAEVLDRLRRLGLSPIEAEEAANAAAPKIKKSNGATRRALANALSELAVLLNAGLTLERALQVTTENIQRDNVKGAFKFVREKVKHGASLARAMSESGTFTPMACAMAEAGEASGKLDVSLGRLADALERAENLRQTITSALIYPTMLLCIAIGVVLMMLLFVVPQFESLFEDMGGQLPFATRVVVGASNALQNYGWWGLIGLIVLVFAIGRWLKQRSVRLAFDRFVLRVPKVGSLVAAAETARFGRTLGSLIEGGVALPLAMSIAQRSLINTHMAAAIGRVTAGLKEGGGLSGPLAASGVFPPVALSFLRTGEETAQLGAMLTRLADVLDREVRVAVERLITILTPTVTVFMGALVAFVIVSILSAILGFNDLVMQS